MHSITTLRKELGLTTTNQVRNRIEAIKDLLHDQIRRGPNNQILLTDEGLEQLRRLQELYDSGLTISEASGVMRADSLPKGRTRSHVSPALPSIDVKPDEARREVAALRKEVARLRQTLVALDARLASPSTPSARSDEPWWIALREEIDAP